ncbi:facilitated trehalose transporter Tret1-like [Agrilus planipennis]|uniref:Facilitated trehalose transporter Tret1-like n=1 Tax=Agrilus planipennis TaxID=224129 RepID=A0A1W4WNH1_AGRPL|nr:facilitated trehalose transporter Tret1-like [Agrilus planipennis]XP_018321663.1 facilitated trehalose transporter Tret1-like [Agrilus planipennis]
MKKELIKKSWRQLLAVLSATVCTISDGMHYGWTAPILPQLKGNDSSIEITHTDEIWLENIYMAGILAGLGITAWLIILFGIKFTILLGAGFHLISWILIGSNLGKEVLYVARFISGIAGNVAFVSVPMYIGEISDKNMRGFFGTFIFTLSLLGLLVIYSIGPYVSITYSSIVGACCALTQLVAFSFMPESPYCLLVKGKKEKALKSLKWLRNDKEVTEEMDDIAKAVERQQSEKGRFIDVFLIKSNRKAFLTIAVLNFSQHFSGISVFLMNLHTILSDAASIVPSDKAGIIVSAVMLLSGILSSIAVDKIGRKILIIGSSIVTGFSLLIFAGYFLVKEMGYDVTPFNWLPLFSVILYSIAFKFGLGMVPIVLIGELFPTSVKAKGMTISDITYALFGLFSIYVYMYLVDAFGMYVPFFLFAVCCYVAAIFVALYVPETKGKTLEEIQIILKGQYQK